MRKSKYSKRVYMRKILLFGHPLFVKIKIKMMIMMGGLKMMIMMGGLETD